MPLDAVTSIIKEQLQWEKSGQRKSSSDSIHKRYYILNYDLLVPIKEVHY